MRRERSSSRKRSRNWSATESTTMKRLAAMQLWPLLTRRASAAVHAAAVRSASARTMKGSLPPSSSTVLLSEKDLGVVRIVFADPGALLDFRLGLDNRFPHLESHGAGVFGFASPQETRRVPHPLCPPSKGDHPPFEKRRVCDCKSSFQFPL